MPTYLKIEAAELLSQPGGQLAMIVRRMDSEAWDQRSDEQVLATLRDEVVIQNIVDGLPYSLSATISSAAPGIRPRVFILRLDPHAALNAIMRRAYTTTPGLLIVNPADFLFVRRGRSPSR